MKTLGLDIGTNSIGWGIVDEFSTSKHIQNCGVYVFPEGVKKEKNNESSKAAERTGFRLQRRGKFRRRLRKYETLKVLIEYGMCPLSLDELENWRKNKQYPNSPDFIKWYRTDEGKEKKQPESERTKWEPYFLRKKCVEMKAEKFELGRALYHLAQRRGFLSNRKETTKATDGKVSGQISEITAAKGDRTLGQYFYDLKKAGEKVRGKYTSRKFHYEEEFDKICEVQHISAELREKLYRAIFFQRKLKSQKFLVGKCTFEPNKPRCPISHFEFEEFRMLSFINSIKVQRRESEAETEKKKEWVFLTSEERNSILPLFFRAKDAFKFGEIAKKIKKRNEYWQFNYRDYVTVPVCPVSTQLKKNFGETWKATQIGKYDIYDIWHVLFDFDDDDKLKEFALDKLKLDTELAEKFCKISLQQGYANLSLKAIRNILPFLREGFIYSHAAFLANIPTMIGKEVFDKPENKEKILTGIQVIIDTIRDKNTIIAVTNSTLEKIFKDTTCNFRLEPWKKEILDTQLADFYGKKKWNEFSHESQGAIRNEIIEKIEDSLKIAVRNNANDYKYPALRIDDLILDFLLESGFTIKKSAQLYHPSDIEYFEKQKPSEDQRVYLGSPRTSSVKNPVVMRALHQLRKLINFLIKTNEINETTRIHVELANEVNDKNWRKAIEEYQKDNEGKNAAWSQKLSEAACQNGLELQPTESDIKKYRLWQEQKETCPYTGKHISFTSLFGEMPQFDFEHTIPRSLSYDDSLENLTLCDVHFNRNVKKQQIPADLANYDEILQYVNKFYQDAIDRCLLTIANNTIKGGYVAPDIKDKKIVARHKAQLELDYYKGKLKRFMLSEVTGGFKNSQLNDTRIITKFSLAYLKTAFTYVHPVNGSITDILKKQWGLLRQGEAKDRTNYRHHVIDALTIACAGRGKYNLLCEVIRNSPDGKHVKLPKPWDSFDVDVLNATAHITPKFFSDDNALRQTKKILRDRQGKPVLKNGQLVYIQGHTARGSLHKDTFYGCIMTPPAKNAKPGKIFVQKISCAKLNVIEAEKIIDSGIKKVFFSNIATKKQSIEDIQKDGILLPYQLKEKDVYVKKIRIKAKPTAPLVLKTHQDIAKKTYKQNYYVVNEENYLLAVYRGFDKKQKQTSDFVVVNLLDAVRAKHKGTPLYPQIYEKNDINLALYKTFKVGKMVLLKEHEAEDVFALSSELLWNRTYRIAGLASSGNDFHIKLTHCSISQPWIYLPSVPFDTMSRFRRFSYSQICCLVEGLDFKVLPTGKIEPLLK